MISMRAIPGALAVLLAACAPTTASPSASSRPSDAASHEAFPTLEVTFTVPISQNFGLEGGCRRQNLELRYADLPGAAIGVRNQEGDTIGEGNLSTTGQVAERVPPDEFGNQNCAFNAAIDLTGAGEFYGVELGQFGGTVLSRAELEAKGWKADLALPDLAQPDP